MTMITPSYLGETIEYSSLHACRSTLEDPTKGEIKRDASAKSGWVITVTARNDADHSETVPLETDVTRMTMTPMARVMPRPETVWSTREQVSVPAHGVTTRRYELPVEVATAIAVAKTPKKAPAKNAWATPVVSFAVAFDQHQAQPQLGGPGRVNEPQMAGAVAD